MKKIKMLGIAPYDGIKNSMERIALQRFEIDIDVFKGNLEDGIEVYHNSVESYEVIISRGGTARLLEKHVDIPVVEISFTVYDILRSMDEAQLKNKKYAIVGYPNLTNTAKELCSVLDYDTEIFTTYSKESVDTTLEFLKIESIELILADTVNYERAKALGIDAILVELGDESINIAINEAIKIGQVYRNLQYENSIYKSLLEMDEYDYYILDSNKEFINSNKFINLSNELIEHINKYVDDVPISTEKNFFFKLDHNQYECRIKCIYLLEEIIYLVRLKLFNKPKNDLNIEVIDKKQALEDYLSSFYNITSSIGNLRENIVYASNSKRPILLIGEIGTGKSEVAKRIYSISEYSNNPLYIIDLVTTSLQDAMELFNNPESPLYNINSNFFIKLGKETPIIIINQLISLIQNSRFSKNNKCIISYKLDYNENRCDGLDILINRIDYFPLYFSPLRECKSDIVSLSNMFLNEKNNSNTKFITGFEEKVFDTFKKYSWPQNFIQLWRVLEQLVENTDSRYISNKLAKDFINIERKTFVSYEAASQSISSNIDIDKTLDEINREIILLKLHENNHNKTKTAAELGISRSTLWRYLK